MCHVISFRLFEDTDTDLVGGHDRFKMHMIFYYYMYIQSNRPKYTILLISTAELHELYILTNSSIKAGKNTRNK